MRHLTILSSHFVHQDVTINKPNLIIRHKLRPWSSWTANSDKKYMELNGAALNVNKPCVTPRKTVLPKDK